MKTSSNKKITLATVKSFIRKNEGRIYLKVRMSFNSMDDALENIKCDFRLVTPPTDPRDSHPEHDLGVHGAWFVSTSGNYFQHYEDDTLIGIEVSNCCKYFILAIKKEAL